MTEMERPGAAQQPPLGREGARGLGYSSSHRCSGRIALLAVGGDGTAMTHGHRVQPQPLAEGRGVQLPGGSPEQYGILLFFIECRCDQERSNPLPPPSH